jgi:DNA adenine methylase
VDQTIVEKSGNLNSPIGSASARPFLKWVGGKSRMISELTSRMPKNFGSYYEPFCGGAALFFTVCPEGATLCDANEELILTYRVVRDQVEGLIESLKNHKNNRRYFYKVREFDRRGDFWTFPEIERASRYIFLNKTCFNGLCRVNSDGQFNVPFGMYKNPKILDEENLRACSAALQSTDLRVGSFQDTLNNCKQKDFVYFDPPYIPLSVTSSFVSYSADGFDYEMQVALREKCVELDKKGVMFMLTNSDTELTRDLYKNFKTESVASPRSISADGSKRKPARDVVVTNY